MLAAHQVNGTLKLYKINFNWNQPDTKDGKQSQAGPQPSLTVTSLLEEGACFPADLSTGDHGGDGASNIDSSLSYQLSYLELLPQAPEQGVKVPSERTVIAVFTITPPPAAVMMDPMSQYQHVSSIVCRWELTTGLQDKLSSSFDQLAVKKKSAATITPRVCSLLIEERAMSDANGMIATGSLKKASGLCTASHCPQCSVHEEPYHVRIHHERWLGSIQI